MFMIALVTENRARRSIDMRDSSLRRANIPGKVCKAHTNPLFMDLKLLKVRDLIKFNQLKFVFEFYKGNLPVEFNNIFEFNSNIHNYETNSASKYLLHIPRIFTATYGNKSIKYQCPLIWNETFRNDIAIDNDASKNVCLNQIHNIYQFKRTLKKHFIYFYSIEQ